MPEFIPIKAKLGYVLKRVIREKVWFISFLDELDNYKAF